MQGHPGLPSRDQARSGKNDRTDGGGRPKNSLKTTGNLDGDDEELDNGDIGDLDDDDEDPNYGDIEDNESPEDEGKTAPVMRAGHPHPPQVSAALFDSTEVFGSTAVGKTQGKPDSAEALPIFYREQPRVEISKGEPDRAEVLPIFPPGTPARKRGQGPWCFGPGTSDQ